MNIQAGKKAALVFFLFSYVATVWPVDFSSYTDDGPTRSGEINYFFIEKDYFNEWETNVRNRVRFYQQAWGMATRSSSVDNRAYLFALAIDLYNTTPPDLMPKLREISSSEANDPGFHPPSEAPVKQQLHGNFLGLKYRRSIEERKSAWNYTKTKLSPERRVVAIELTYLIEHLANQIEKGNITIDDHDAHASLAPEQIDITNPTYYKPLRDYMDRMKSAIEAGVPPWEAEQYLAEEQQSEKRGDTQTAAQSDAEKATQTSNATSEQPGTDESGYTRYLFILVLLAIGVVAFYNFWRRRKR